MVDIAFIKTYEKKLEWVQSQNFVLFGPKNIIDDKRCYKTTSFIICLVIKFRLIPEIDSIATMSNRIVIYS